MEEIWRDIPGYEGIYQVSNKGRVKSLERWIIRKDGYKNHILERIVVQFPVSSINNHMTVCLHKDGIQTKLLVHRLEWEAFIGPIPPGMVINHKDENPANNLLENLMVCTQKENCNWGTLRDRWSLKRKNRPDMSKQTEQYSLDGVLIAVYPSTVEAQRSTGVKCQSIGACCLGKQKTSGGFIWKYAV